MEVKEATHVPQDGIGDQQESLLNHTQSGRSTRGQLEDLDSWNPMSDDFESEAFNSYKEPNINDFVNSFPGKVSQTSQSSTKSKTCQGDVRLFVGRIPQQVTQEGLCNLFCQVGKLSSCNLIPQHNRDTKIGFVGYKTVCEAEAAIQKFDGFDLGQGHRLKVALAMTKQKPSFGDFRDISSDGSNKGIQEHIDDDAASRNESLQNGASSCFISNSKLTSTGQPCSFCGQLGLKWCSACKTPYCSRDCQRNDWPEHKRNCLQQPLLAHRKPTTPPDGLRTSLKTGTSLESAERVTMSHTTSAVLPSPSGDSEQPTDELSTSNAPGDQYTEPVYDKKDPDDLETGEVFDVYNAEMFATMMGFDPTPVKVAENGEDSDCEDSDGSNARTSAFLPDNCKHLDLFPEASGPQTKGPVHDTAITESSAQRSVPEHSMELESVTQPTVDIASNENYAQQHLTCAKGEKRHCIKQLSMETVPSEDFFEVVVTEVENPSCFWAQLCTPEALQRQNKLKKLLQVSYCNSAFENYVPSSGEVCVAQFSLDSCWYRVKVDLVNNTGTLRVTYIDFGNHEDIALDKVRRISEDLARLPRQALKLSLYGISNISSPVQWSSESTTFLKTKVLGIKCKVHVCEQHNEILSVKLSVPGDNTVDSHNTVNEDFIKAGFAETRGQQPSSPHSPNQPENAEKTGLSNIARRQASRANSKQDHENDCEQQRDNPNQDKCSRDSDRNTSLHKQHINLARHYPETQTRREPFEAIINAIVSPWEFYAMKTDKQLLGKLESLMQDLNEQMSGNSSSPECPAPLPGGICAARFSVDSVWYRALILEQVSGGFRVRYIDFGNSEVVLVGDIRPLPQQFQSFPPLSLTCSLAGVRKPKVQNWSVEAIQQFKSLVAERPFLCRIVYTHGDTNIVELLDPCRGREQTVADSLISSGLADAFISRDKSMHQFDVKKGPQFAAQQQKDVATAVGTSPLDDHARSPCSPQLPLSPRSGCTGVSTRNVFSSSFKEDGVESTVFEQAIQATLPQDVRFDVLVTEVVSPGLIYCQLGTVESLQNVAKLTQDMNSHYNAVSYSPFVPHEKSLCAAYFAESGDWCRAFIKEVSINGSVHVHYLDYGNTEMVPPIRVRPLLPQFSFDALPFSALRCSLANIASCDGSGWSDEAVAFIKARLPLFSLYSVRLVGKQKGKLFLDVIAKEMGGSVSKAMVNQRLARAMVNISDTPCIVSPLESLVYQPAVQSARLPQDRSLFDVMVTEVTNSGVFFIQVADYDTAQNLKKLSEDLNTFYHSSKPTSFEPQPNQLCAAHFAKTSDWCRALVSEICSDGLVQVHYVDYGNTEKLPISTIQPLMDNFTASPFFALPCSLANITQPESPGWAGEAMELIKENVPMFQRLSAKLVGKRPGMLFVDFMISKDHPRYLSELLLHEGFAERLTRVNRQGGETRREIQRDLSRPQDESPSANSVATLSVEADLMSNVSEAAYQSIQVLDTFDAMLTNVVSPDLLFIQALRREKFGSSKQLSEGSTNPPPPVEDLKCSLSGIRPAYSSGWSDAARELILSQVPLFSRVNVNVIRKGNGSLVIDATPPNSPKQETVSQFLVSQGIALWEDLPSSSKKHVQPLGGRGYSGKRAELPKQSPLGAICSSSNQVYASAIPLVDVSQNKSYEVIISEVQQPDRIFIQVMSQENKEGLAALSVMLNTHCSTASNSPYKPELGELCCARFTDDGMWYRAVVEQQLSDSRMLVTFVDYGNQDSVAVDSIRRITPAFTRLPLQARQCFLTGIQPQSFWSQDVVNFLKGRVTGGRFIAEIDSVVGKELGLKLFEVKSGPEPHGISINQDLIQHNFARSHEVYFYRGLEMNVPKEDQFDVLITEVIHPGEIWAQIVYAESHDLLNLLMKQINQHCMSTTVPNVMPNPGQECCALFTLDNTWYRARVLECPKPGEIVVQYVDFGNCELVTPDKIRSTKEEFFGLPAQAVKLSLANVRPAFHVWNHEAVEWLKHIVNKKLKTKVVHRLSQHLVVLLDDWAAPEGPCNINEELVRMKFAVKC